VFNPQKELGIRELGAVQLLEAVSHSVLFPQNAVGEKALHVLEMESHVVFAPQKESCFLH
jgi:hypothetical protein